jgi:hypothetical protein
MQLGELFVVVCYTGIDFYDTEVEIDRLFEQLSQDGQVLMELFQRPLVKNSVFPGN